MRPGLRLSPALLGLLLGAGAWVSAGEAAPTVQSIADRRVFPAPLVPVGAQPDRAENAALDRALAGYLAGGDAEAIAPLLAFLDQYPASTWRAALLTSLGDIYERQGLMTRAQDSWREAWGLTRSAGSPAATALSDRCAGSLLRFWSRLGRRKELSALLEEAKAFPVQGAEAVWVAEAEKTLLLMDHEPQNVFRCGPAALGFMAQAVGKGPVLAGKLDTLQVNPDGTTLAQIQAWGQETDLPLRGIQREPGSSLPVPSILHLKIGHFATIVGQEGNRFLVKNYLGGGDRLLTQKVIDEESSGLALVPEGVNPLRGWKTAGIQTLAAAWGTGYTSGSDPRNPWHDAGANVPSSCGMPRYQFIPAQASLDLEDTPLWYVPPVGPAVQFHLTYNNTDNNLPYPFTFWNVGQKWNCGWLSYVVDDPANPGLNTTIYQRGGGVLNYSGYNPATGSFAANYYQPDILVRTSSNSYDRSFPDGSKERFAVPSGTLAPRRVFLSQVVDPAGNTLSFTYDALFRLTAVTDALGQVTTLSYTGSDPLQVTQVKDPFGRTAVLHYGAAVQNPFPPATGGTNAFLASITDMGGLTSSFQYASSAASGAISVAGAAVALAKTAPVRLAPATVAAPLSLSAIQAACDNPSSSTSALRSAGLAKTLVKSASLTAAASISTDDAWALLTQSGGRFTYYPNFFPFITALTTPYGTTTFTGGAYGVDQMIQATDPLGQTERLEFHNYTGEMPYSDAVVPPGFANQYLYYRNAFYWDKRAMAQAPGDWTQAVISHFCHSNNNSGYTSPTLESLKKPLESRIWNGYGGSNSIVEGPSRQATLVSRVLDDGSTQSIQKAYNGLGNVTRSVDAAGRSTTYSYATNGVDLLQVANTTGGGNEIQASYTYNPQHKPLTITDASGQTTTLTYNASGQVHTITNPKQETTTFSYVPSQGGYLARIDGPFAGSSTLFTYDSCGRVATVTDPEGRTVGTTYDNLDRVTLVDYPDGTSEHRYYNNLDLSATIDRKGQMTAMQYNPLRQLTQVQDAQGRTTQLSWCNCGNLEQLIDPRGQITNWWRDLQGRVIGKSLADGTQTGYTYDGAGRLLTRVDAKGQMTNYQYLVDDKLGQVSYTQTQNPTPTVSYSYDPKYPRLATMVDGYGQTTYGYNPVTASPVLGAGRLASVIGPFPNSELDYSYDELGRVVSRGINGVAETRAFDSLGRIGAVSNPLGTFQYGYVGGTNRLSTISLPNGQTTSFSYFDASQDFRLHGITNQRLNQSVISAFAYTYDPNGMIQTWSQQADANLPKVYSFPYDAANQLLGAVLLDSAGNVLHQYGYGYDLAGNRTAEQIDNQLTSSTFNNVNQLLTQATETLAVPAVVPQAVKAKSGGASAKPTHSKPAAVSP